VATAVANRRDERSQPHQPHSRTAQTPLHVETQPDLKDSPARRERPGEGRGAPDGCGEETAGSGKSISPCGLRRRASTTPASAAAGVAPAASAMHASRTARQKTGDRIFRSFVVTIFVRHHHHSSVGFPEAVRAEPERFHVAFTDAEFPARQKLCPSSNVSFIGNPYMQH